MCESSTDWTSAAAAATLYIYKKRMQNEGELQKLAKNPMKLFNAFANEAGVAIQDENLALWAKGFLVDLASLPLDRLKRAIAYDAEDIK